MFHFSPRIVFTIAVQTDSITIDFFSDLSMVFIHQNVQWMRRGEPVFNCFPPSPVLALVSLVLSRCSLPHCHYCLGINDTTQAQAAQMQAERGSDTARLAGVPGGASRHAWIVGALADFRRMASQYEGHMDGDQSGRGGATGDRAHSHRQDQSAAAAVAPFGLGGKMATAATAPTYSSGNFRLMDLSQMGKACIGGVGSVRSVPEHSRIRADAESSCHSTQGPQAGSYQLTGAVLCPPLPRFHVHARACVSLAFMDAAILRNHATCAAYFRSNRTIRDRVHVHICVRRNPISGIGDAGVGSTQAGFHDGTRLLLYPCRVPPERAPPQSKVGEKLGMTKYFWLKTLHKMVRTIEKAGPIRNSKKQSSSAPKSVGKPSKLSQELRAGRCGGPVHQGTNQSIFTLACDHGSQYLTNRNSTECGNRSEGRSNAKKTTTTHAKYKFYPERHEHNGGENCTSKNSQLTLTG